MRLALFTKYEGISLYKVYPLILLGVTFLAYGLFIPWLGFYLDDWYIVWFRHFFGSQAFTQFFSQDRPFLSWVYIILTPIMGDSTIAWQSFAVITRWVLGLAFWDLLQQIWPEHKFEATVGALLYTVFPGFQFHWFSVQYSQVYLIEAGMLFSLACSLRGARKTYQALFWMLAGLPMGVYALIAVEYNYGLELIRPVLIFMVLSQAGLPFWQRILKAGLHWLPYLIPFVAFSIWRTFIFSPFQYDISIPEKLTGFSFKDFLSFLLTLGKELLDALVLVWGQIFTPSQLSIPGRVGIIAAVVTVFGFLILLFYLLNLRKLLPSQNFLCWSWMTILLGLLTVVLTMIPFKVGGLAVSLSFPWNRFMVVVGFGSVIFGIGVLSLLQNKRGMVIVSALLISVSILSQINTANQFRTAWADQKMLFWQLVWRIPGIEPNTMLITDTLRFAKFFSGTSLSSPLNWTYAPNLSSYQVPYQMILLESPQIDNSHALQADQIYDIHFRSFRFTGNTSRSIFFVFNTKDCLQVISPSTNNMDTITEYHSEGLFESIGLSDLSLIDPTPLYPAQLPARIFGVEPDHGWCYHYQKADLARQQGDWKGTLTWFAKAEELGYTSLQDTEMYPKIEALAMTSNWVKARELTDALLAKGPFLNRGLCAIWERSVENNPPQGTNRELTEELVDLLQCPEIKEVLR